MEKKIATIYDLNRMCMASECANCELYDSKCIVRHTVMAGKLDYVNEIIIKWCEGHPVKTRQSEFLKMFPNAVTEKNGVIGICPATVNKSLQKMCYDRIDKSCDKCLTCKQEFWSQEVE